MPLTADARRPVSSRTGPCSMCSSREASAPSRLAAAPDAPSRSTPQRGERVLQPGALAVEQVADVVGIERAGGGRGAEQAAAEARALLVGPVHQADRRRAAARRPPPARAGRRARPAGRGSRRASRPTARRRCASRRSRTRRPRRRRAARPRCCRPGRGRRSPAARRACRAATRARPASPASRRARRAPSGPPWRSCSSRRSARTRSTSISRLMRCTAARGADARDEAAVAGRVRISPRS